MLLLYFCWPLAAKVYLGCRREIVRENAVFCRQLSEIILQVKKESRRWRFVMDGVSSEAQPVNPPHPRFQCWRELSFELAKLFPAGRRKSNTCENQSSTLKSGVRGNPTSIQNAPIIFTCKICSDNSTCRQRPGNNSASKKLKINPKCGLGIMIFVCFDFYSKV